MSIWLTVRLQIQLAMGSDHCESDGCEGDREIVLEGGTIKRCAEAHFAGIGKYRTAIGIRGLETCRNLGGGWRRRFGGTRRRSGGVETRGCRCLRGKRFDHRRRRRWARVQIVDEY